MDSHDVTRTLLNRAKGLIALRSQSQEYRMDMHPHVVWEYVNSSKRLKNALKNGVDSVQFREFSLADNEFEVAETDQPADILPEVLASKFSKAVKSTLQELEEEAAANQGAVVPRRRSSKKRRR